MFGLLVAARAVQQSLLDAPANLCPMWSDRCGRIRELFIFGISIVGFVLC